MNQLCPLCGNPATYEISHRPYCKHFTCRICVAFYIDEVAEIHTAAAPKAHRLVQSAEAVAAIARGEIMVLRESNDAEKKSQPHPTPIVTREFVKR